MTDFAEQRKGSAGRDPGLVWDAERFEQTRDSLLAENAEELQSSLETVHRLLETNKKRNENISKLIDAKVAEAVVSLLQRDEPNVRKLSLGIIGFLASGTLAQASFIVSLSVLPVLVSESQVPATETAHTEVQETAIWALGKISERSVQLRDQVVDAGGFQAVLSTIHRLSDLPSSQILGRKAAFALSTFYGRKPPLDAQRLPAAVTALHRLLDTQDVETTALACRCISTIAEGPIEANIDVLLDPTVAPSLPERLMQCLSSAESVQSTSLRAIGSILTGNSRHTQVFLDLHLLPALCPFLSHPKKAMRREVVWVISNITAEPDHQQVQAVVDTPGLLPTLVTLLNTDPEIEVRQEAIWALSNLANSAQDAHVLSVLHAGFLSAIADLLSDPAMGKLLPIALEALQKMLGTAREKDGQWAMIQSILAASHVEEQLEALTSHRHIDVVESAQALLGDFFGHDDMDDAK